MKYLPVHKYDFRLNFISLDLKFEHHNNNEITFSSRAIQEQTQKFGYKYLTKSFEFIHDVEQTGIIITLPTNI